jgi:hypothetical protein
MEVTSLAALTNSKTTEMSQRDAIRALRGKDAYQEYN